MTPTQVFLCQVSKTFKNTFFKEHLRWLLLYILYTHDVTCNQSRWNNGYNGNYKKDEKKLKHFENIVFWNKFYIIFHFLSLYIFISVHNIGRSIPLRNFQEQLFLKNTSLEILCDDRIFWTYLFTKSTYFVFLVPLLWFPPS